MKTESEKFRTDLLNDMAELEKLGDKIPKKVMDFVRTGNLNEYLNMEVSEAVDLIIQVEG